MIQNKESLFSDGGGVKSIYNAEEIDLTEHEVFENPFQESTVDNVTETFSNFSFSTKEDEDVTETFSNFSFSSKEDDYSPSGFGDIKGFDINLDEHEVFKLD